MADIMKAGGAGGGAASTSIRNRLALGGDVGWAKIKPANVKRFLEERQNAPKSDRRRAVEARRRGGGLAATQPGGIVIEEEHAMAAS